MSKRFVSSWCVLLLLFANPSLAADVHAVFTSWSSSYGRERTSKAELWIGTDKQCYLAPDETRIVRRDLGLLWRMQPNGKTYREQPLQPEASLDAKAGIRQRTEQRPTASIGQQKDLRFIGFFDEEPPFEWTVRPLDDDVVQGQPCKVYSVEGDADFADADVRIWISPNGKERGLAAPGEFVSGVLRHEKGVADAINEILARYPDGGLLQLEKSTNPPIGAERKARISLDLYETREPPAGIYEIPMGVQKEGGESS